MMEAMTRRRRRPSILLNILVASSSYWPFLLLLLSGEEHNKYGRYTSGNHWSIETSFYISSATNTVETSMSSSSSSFSLFVSTNVFVHGWMGLHSFRNKNYQRRHHYRRRITVNDILFQKRQQQQQQQQQKQRNLPSHGAGTNVMKSMLQRRRRKKRKSNIKQERNENDNVDGLHINTVNSTLSSSSSSSLFSMEHNDKEAIEKIIHEYFMNIALEQARIAERKGEVPIGAIVVQRHWVNESNSNGDNKNYDDFSSSLLSLKEYSNYEYRIVSTGYNLVETRQDASAHAELLALRMAAHNHYTDQNHEQYHMKGEKQQGSIKSMMMNNVLWKKFVNTTNLQRRRRRRSNWRLGDNTTLYTTLEPCPMCLSASQAFRVTSIVYGAPDLRIGAIETYMNMLDDYVHPYHIINRTAGHVVSGICDEESKELLQHFFKKQRKLHKEMKKEKSKYKQEERQRNKEKKRKRRQQQSTENK